MNEYKATKNKEVGGYDYRGFHIHHLDGTKGFSVLASGADLRPEYAAITGLMTIQIAKAEVDAMLEEEKAVEGAEVKELAAEEQEAIAEPVKTDYIDPFLMKYIPMKHAGYIVDIHTEEKKYYAILGKSRTPVSGYTNWELFKKAIKREIEVKHIQ